MRLKLLALFILCGSFLGGVHFSAAQTARPYTLHLPPDYESRDSVPLLVALHPSASSGKAMQTLTGFDEIADEHGFMVVYPNSEDIAWNDGRAGLELETDDAGYLDSLMDELITSHKADAEKIYLVGWSGGGLMAYRLACQMPDKFAGVAVLGALLWDEQRDICAEFVVESPVNLLVLHGTADWIYPAETHTSDYFDAEILGVRDTLAFWAERNGCPAELTTPQNNLMVVEGCNLAAYDIAGSKQNWPRAGDYQLNQVGISASSLIFDFFMGENAWAVEQPETAQLTRNYTLYVPDSYDPTQATPLVIALHGRTQTPTSMANMTDWNTLAEQEKFVVVYPEGIDLQWNYYAGFPNYPADPHNDTEFLSALIADLSLDLNIDPTRVYLTGFSNGGFMVNRLACEAPDQYAAFASVAGSAFEEFTTLCSEGQQVNMLMIHGTADNNILWEGYQQTAPNGQTVYITVPITGLFSYWGNYNGCNAEGYDVEDVPPSGDSPGTNVRIIRMKDCANEAEVLLYGVAGGGHNWPGYGDRLPPEIAGTVNRDINATEEIWEFFSRHSLPAVPPSRIDIQGENFNPEGLEYDTENERFLISSLDEGTVYQIAYDGTATPFVEDETLIGSVGLEIEANRLYVVNASLEDSGIALLGIYDMTTREQIHRVDLGALAPNYRHFPNDVAVDAAGNAYITDSLAPLIYQVDAEGNASILLEDERLLIDGFGGNGIVYHPDGYLLVGISGVELYKIPLDNPSEITVIETPQTIAADGMLLAEDNSLIVVSNGMVLQLTSEDDWLSAEVTARAFNHPASTAAFVGKEVYVIHPRANEIVRVQFPD